jgi:hypothetical protein
MKGKTPPAKRSRDNIMVYKQKLLILSVISAVLALILTATFIFSPDRVQKRSSLYTWLDPKWIEQADRLEIKGNDTTILVKNNNVWYAQIDGKEYPANQFRIDDLFQVLSAKADYALRGNEVSSQERLGLTEESAARSLVRGGPAGPPLLDLLIGNSDAAGKEVYLRKNNRNEIRSGEDKFSGLIFAASTVWYNLRLFPDEVRTQLGTDMIQRVIVTSPLGAAPAGEEPAQPPLVITRIPDGWTIDGIEAELLDTSAIEPYFRAILDADGDDFIIDLQANDPVFNEGRLLLEFGDGNSRIIRLGPVLPGSDPAKRGVTISGSPYVYSLSAWMVNRIFRTVENFRKH